MRLAKAFLPAFILLIVGSPFTQPITHAETYGDTISIVAPDSLVPLGTSFIMSVDASNSETLWKIIMNFALKDTDLVRLDFFSFDQDEQY